MRKTFIAAALCALAATTTAYADDVLFEGYAHGSQAVTFTVPALSGPGTASATVNAGGFLTRLNGGSSFTSYCVDLYQTIGFGTTYNDYSQVGGGHMFANSDAYADLGRLYATAGSIFDALHEAAFQIAVWEIAYETADTYSLSGGVATFGGTAEATALASSWLSALGNHGSGPAVSVLESLGHQDVIYAPVPEPSEIALMLTGLVAMAGVARRRRNKASAR